MKKICEYILTIFYCVGLICVIAACFSRFCFYSVWTLRDELILWTLIIVFFCCHYFFLLLLDKLGYLSFGFLHIFKIVDIIYSCFQLVVIIFLCVSPWFNVSFCSLFPMIVLPVVALVLRSLLNRKF